MKIVIENLLTYVLAALAVAVFIVPPVYSGGEGTNVSVSASVLPYVKKDILYQAAVVRVTERDIKRGYVEVGAATVIRVRTNAAGGYMLSFAYNGGPFREIWVMDGKRTVVLSDLGGLIHWPGRGPGVETQRLSYRFVLADKAKPGVYSWPLSIDVAVN